MPVPQLLRIKMIWNVSGNFHTRIFIILPLFVYLHHKIAIRVIEAYKMTMKLGDTEVFKELSCKPYAQIFPGCENKFVEGNPLANDYVECKVRHLSASYLHPAGSCKMGGLNDPTSVVDPNLKVKRVHGLRIIDGSVMPSVTSGNIQAPIVMIAEKGADLIKAERKALYSGYYYTGLQLLTKITPYFHYQYHYQ